MSKDARERRGRIHIPNIPNLFIAGAAKAGTSSLYHYLTQHPAVYMSHIKEPHYLCSHHFPAKFTGPGDEGFSDNVVRNKAAYLKLYENVGNATILGDASVYYLYYPDTPKLIHELNPDAKVVIILRNPVDRAFSAYSHTVRDGRETLTFEEALLRERERQEMGYQPLWWYKEIGMYAAQVKRYLDTFDNQHLRVYLYEDLKDMDRVVREIISFIGINQDVQIDTSIRHNASGVPRSRWLYNFFAKPNPLKNALKPLLPTRVQQRLGNKAKNMTLKRLELRPETRFRLTKEFQSDIEELEGLIGRDLSRWVRVDSLEGAIAK